MRPLELVALQDKQTGAFYYETGEGYIARHIAQLPHGSVIGFRHNNTVLYVFWENAKVTVYRKSDWKDQETRRLAAAGETESHSRGRGYRHLPEHYIDFGPIAEDGTITQEQMDEFMEAWETLKERLSFEQALDSFFAERRNGRSEDIDEMTLSLLEKSSDNAIPPVARELSADELEDPFNEEVLYGNSNSPLDNAGGFARRKRQTSGGHPDDEADRQVGSLNPEHAYGNHYPSYHAKQHDNDAHIANFTSDHYDKYYKTLAPTDFHGHNDYDNNSKGNHAGSYFDFRSTQPTWCRANDYARAV
ncbi:hypothetical protein AAVH_12900 [Aphelenchoides avenae]|nr:hypothetical protein AAVH_12900 [Aphelenchus avenae]